MLTPEEIQEIRTLFEQGLPIRAIAKRIARNVKTVRQALDRPSAPKKESLLDPFREAVRQKVQQDLSISRILREIRETGYTGSRTILADFIRSIRGPKKPHRKVFRRFETKKGEEAQVDWSPYRVKIAGIETVVHCFSMILCYSRRMFIAFHKNERLPTLLFAHIEAFAYHAGFPERLVYDNQTQVTLGRLDGKPLFNPNFLPFAKYYGFTPFTHRVGHKERSGKVERPFTYIHSDFVKNRSFDSWEDLNAQARHWLDTVANVRKHDTTKRFVHEAYAEEKPYLIELPEAPFPTERREVRKVHKDGYLSVDGSYYPAPAHLVGQFVTVAVYPTRIEVLDARGKVVVTYKVPDRPTRIEPTEPSPAPRQPISRPALETRFLACFPEAAPFLSGLKRRMNALTPIHLKEIERLADLFGLAPTAAALGRAQAYGNFSAPAVRRILEKAHPNVVPEPPTHTANPAALGALDDVDSGSPEDYTFDSEGGTDVPQGT